MDMPRVRLKPATGFRRYAIPRTGGEGIERLKVGEVRVHVALTNTIDEGMVRRGVMPSSDVRRYEAEALVDTGAIRLCIPQDAVDELGLAIVEEIPVVLADGKEARVGVSEPVTVRLLTRHVVQQALVLGDEVLIGQTVLEETDLFVDPINGRVIPNPEHPERAILRVK
jgi:clan AA aspartic protease